ncbi:recombinase family protein [Nonomuraea coxensis]|uniref:recombinase family protein n=1 Tax=Nonomuraea coxensis TaxID=404386 RepID=UPI0009FC309E
MRYSRHRSGIAWSTSAVRAILLNPRYTGRQVWNKQHKQEELLDVNDITQGHVTKLRRRSSMSRSSILRRSRRRRRCCRPAGGRRTGASPAACRAPTSCATCSTQDGCY